MSILSCKSPRKSANCSRRWISATCRRRSTGTLLDAIELGEIPDVLANEDDGVSELVDFTELFDAIDLLNAWNAADLTDLWENKRELDDAMDELEDGDDAGMVEDAVSDVANADEDGDGLLGDEDENEDGVLDTGMDVGSAAKEALGDIDVAEDPELPGRNPAAGDGRHRRLPDGAARDTRDVREALRVQPREDAPAGHEYELAKSDGGVDDFDRSARPRQRHPLFDGATGGQTLDGTDSKANLRPPVRTRAGTTTEEEQ